VSESNRGGTVARSGPLSLRQCDFMRSVVIGPQVRRKNAPIKRISRRGETSHEQRNQQNAGIIILLKLYPEVHGGGAVTSPVSHHGRPHWETVHGFGYGILILVTDPNLLDDATPMKAARNDRANAADLGMAAIQNRGHIRGDSCSRQRRLKRRRRRRERRNSKQDGGS
jgi:hypothetical protein